MNPKIESWRNRLQINLKKVTRKLKKAILCQKTGPTERDAAIKGKYGQLLYMSIFSLTYRISYSYGGKIQTYSLRHDKMTYMRELIGYVVGDWMHIIPCNHIDG